MPQHPCASGSYSKSSHISPFLHLKISEPLCKPSPQHPSQGFLTAPAHTQPPPFPAPYAGTVHMTFISLTTGQALGVCPQLLPGHLGFLKRGFSSVQFISAARSCLALCDPMDCSTPGLPVHHQLPEITQTHVPGVNDATQPSHPLSSPLSLALSLFQHQVLFFFQ